MPRAPKPCGRRDCETRVVGRTYCAKHQAEVDARANTTARGYGASHQALTRNPAYLAATKCVTCGVPFTMANPKTAGHRIAIRNGGLASGIQPECRRCNYGWLRTGT